MIKEGIYLVLGIVIFLILRNRAVHRIKKDKKAVIELFDTAVEKGERINGKVAITNQGFLPAWHVKIPVTLHNTLTDERMRTTIRADIPARATTKVPFHLSTRHCGKGKISILGKEETFLVYPELSEVEILKVPPSASNQDPEAYDNRKKGFDVTETIGIREYRSGDSIKSIHHKLSGKYEELMVKEPGFPVEQRYLLLIDPGGEEEKKVTGEAAESFAEYVLSYGTALFEQQIPFQYLLWKEEEFINHAVTCEEDFMDFMGCVFAFNESKTQEHVKFYYEQNQELFEKNQVIYITPKETVWL